MRLLMNLFSVWIVALACGGFWSTMEITGTERVSFVTTH